MIRRITFVVTCAILGLSLISCGKGEEAPPDNEIAGTWEGEWSSGGSSGQAKLTVSPYSHLNGTLTGGNLTGGGTLTGKMTPAGAADGSLSVDNVIVSAFTGSFSITGTNLTGSIDTNNNEQITFDLARK